MSSPPRVFVSHASEDKERFVNRFAARLRENGIDAWLDKWEMLPGDSLVDKIFEEGLKGAQAVIIVLSSVSVGKPWVREELNAAVVKRISTGSKLIPVVIDNCDVPEALKSTLWQRIENFESYQDSFDRILAAIFGTSDRPPIGTPPPYTPHLAQTIGTLTKVDSLVLRLACEEAIATGSALIEPEELYVRDGKPLLPETELRDAMEMLEQQYLVRVHHMIGSSLSSFQITTHGFEEYARTYIPGYDALVRDVASTLVNRQKETDQAIAADLGKPLFIVQHILQVLEDAGHLKLSKNIGGPQHVYNVAASLRRALAS
ncbi:SEFIR domain-containing protein [Burkholderia lata]|uniref:SEFIR domain-containing protein n=1 Tax=Burkholderia lata (strain ATCC 17760 / DSM 23089 / LMG 22485 / NCIMB 9086 / R18194 / 383) TaxID=482957 RepID=A0A6P2UGH9_BURL3|nr:toll/interleukin-1 receptor domain-containing protein [Burkholderia lata]VWC75832.1 SEFIR domain-containing protein [Burkholderia lata]